MQDQSTIKTALERNVRAVTLRPSVGQGTARTKVRLGAGLACEVEDGQWKLSVGMHEKYGGVNSGPNPGVLGRAALGTCLAIGYGMWAARLGVALDALEVEVEADYDVRGELGAAEEVSPAYLEVRYRVKVATSASETDLLNLLDTADRFSSYRAMYAEPIRLVREVVRIASPAE